MDVHGAECLEQEFCAVVERVPNLASLAGVGVRVGIVIFVRSGRGGIQVGLRIVVKGEVDEGFGEVWCVGMVCKAEGGGADKVLEGIQSRSVVAVVQCPLVCSKEGQDSGDIRAGQNGQPVNEIADGLVGSFAFREVGVVWVQIRDGIDGAAQAEWGHVGDLVAVFESKAGGGVF